MSKQCPICDSQEVTFVRDKIKNATTNVYRCSPCDLEFLETWDDVEHVKSLYEGDNYIFTHNIEEVSNAKSLKFDEYQERLKWMKPYLDKGKHVLEIGCGDGKFMRLLKPYVATVEGLELSPPQVELLRAEGFICYDVMIDEMDPPRKYDVICMFALLEHVPNVKKFLATLKTYMHEKTEVFIEVPNLNDPIVKGFKIEQYREFYYRPVHLYYFTVNSIGKLLNEIGFNFETHTNQQASITNHFHWMHHGKGQPNANCMTSVVPPVEIEEGTGMKEIMEKVDDYYRTLLIEHDKGDLLSVKITLR